jgi:hypothetical protein
MRWTGQLLIVLALLIVGCARGDWIDQTLTLVDVTGTWEGVFKFQGTLPGSLERSTRWVLQQKGGKVRGEAHGLDGGRAAPIEGLVNGEVFSWQLAGRFFRWAPGNPYRGQVTITVDEMSGRADGFNCPCIVILRRAASDAREKEAR